MNVEAERTSGRLESQVREAASIEQRMARAEQETADLETRLAAERHRARRACRQPSRELDSEMQEVRTGLMEKNRSRDEIQARVREAEKTIEASRSVILRLLGEASGIRNQIAQADTYLAGIERERTRVQKEEQVAAAEIERLDRREAAAFRKHRPAADWKLQTVVGDRRETEEELAGKRSGGGRTAPADRSAAGRMFAPAGEARIAGEHPLAPHLRHGIHPHAAGARIQNRWRAGRFHRSGPGMGTSAGRIPARRAGIRRGEGLAAGGAQHGPAAGELEGRATFLVEAATAGNDAEEAAASAVDLPRLSDCVTFTNGLTNKSILCPSGQLLSARRPGPGATPWPSASRQVISCWPTASATAAAC